MNCNIEVDEKQIIWKMMNNQMKDLLYTIHQQIIIIYLETLEPSIQLLLDTFQKNLT